MHRQHVFDVPCNLPDIRESSFNMRRGGGGGEDIEGGLGKFLDNRKVACVAAGRVTGSFRDLKIRGPEG